MTIAIALLWFPVPVRATLLDERPGALAAYSLRRLAEGHQGPVERIRRAADDREQDFGFNRAGDGVPNALDLGRVTFVCVLQTDRRGNGPSAAARWRVPLAG